ncbi:MAG TPA: hypothetical protein V6C76_05345 [Drouetiella sp.]
MKLSKLLAASLTLVSAVAVFASGAEARNPLKGTGTLGSVPTVFAAECGTDPNTFASFNGTGVTSQQNVPLTVSVNESTVLTSGYAGDLVFIPTSNLNIVDLSTFTPMTQGTYQQTVSVRPSTYTGDPGLELAYAFSWVNKNGVTKYGISFVPASFVTISTPISNHALKGKSVDSFLTADTVLTDLQSAGALINVLPAPNNAQPGNAATNFQLLGLGCALVNLGGAGTNVLATFNNFGLNGAAITQYAVDPSLNINCAPFFGGAAAAAKTNAVGR